MLLLPFMLPNVIISTSSENQLGKLVCHSQVLSLSSLCVRPGWWQVIGPSNRCVWLAEERQLLSQALNCRKLCQVSVLYI